MAAIEDRAVEKTDVVVLAFERLDFFFDERVELGQIGGHVGGNIKIHGITPRLTDVRGVPNCGDEWKRNRYRSVCAAIPSQGVLRASRVLARGPLCRSVASPQICSGLCAHRN